MMESKDGVAMGETVVTYTRGVMVSVRRWVVCLASIAGHTGRIFPHCFYPRTQSS